MLWDGNECGKNYSDENFRAAIPSIDLIDQKQLENVEYLNCLGSMITIDDRGIWETKSRIQMGKAAFNNKKTFYQQIGPNFMEETGKVQHLEYSFI